MTIHKNSKEAFKTLKNKLSARALIIWEKLILHGPMTDRELLKLLAEQDMNFVRPRITELIQKNFVKEIGTEKCITTKRRVRVVSGITEVEWSESFKNKQNQMELF